MVRIFFFGPPRSGHCNLGKEQSYHGNYIEQPFPFVRISYQALTRREYLLQTVPRLGRSGPWMDVFAVRTDDTIYYQDLVDSAAGSTTEQPDRYQIHP